MSKAKNIVKLASSLSDSAVVPISSGGTGANTAQAALTALGAGGATLKISSITVTDSSYNTLDDAAVDTAGGYVKITGTGFASGCQVVVNQTPASSTTYISATEVRAQLPATTAGTYVVYVVNSDGGVAIRVNGVSFSALPTWTTTSPLSSVSSGDPISIQLAATAATTYTLAAGSTLPTGLTLSSTGLLSGVVSSESETVYNFTITATDAEAQDSPKTFTISITIGEPYFRNTVLLLNGDGVDAGTNNTFLDSSTNNFTVTRTGTPTQGSVSPFSPTGWSGYFNGSTDYLSIPDSAALQLASSNFTIEAWVYNISLPAAAAYKTLWGKRSSSTGIGGVLLVLDSSNNYQVFVASNSTTWGVLQTTGQTVTLNTWTHLALVRSGNNLILYKNGIAGTTLNLSFSVYDSGSLSLMAGSAVGTQNTDGYMSNFRLVKGTALYTSNFTPSLTPLTAVANTSLLTLQDNRFVDNSTNAFAITTAGTPSIQALSPFAPAAAYSTSTHGGSMYFNGSTDSLSILNNTAFNLSSGSWTLECWVYLTGGSNYRTFISKRSGANAEWEIGLNTTNNLYFYTSTIYASSIAVSNNVWTHCSVTYDGTNLRLFINGTLALTQAGATAVTGTSSVYIGSTYSGGAQYTTGYIANVRMVKGTAVYTAAFTPPTAPVTAVTNTSLLLNGTNAAIYDATGKSNLTTVGDAKISTAVKKYGTGSLSFDGTGDYLSLSYNSAFNLGTGSFTWEAWIYPTNISGIKAIYSTSGGSGANPKFVIHLNAGTPNIHYNNLTGGSDIYTVATSAVVVNTWTHLAFVRNGSTWTWYINGVSAGTGSNSTNITFTTQSTYIGYGGESYFTEFNGYIDDLRVTKGYARYTANFTPPTAAHVLK